jgi:hypothetical protein
MWLEDVPAWDVLTEFGISQSWKKEVKKKSEGTTSPTDELKRIAGLRRADGYSMVFKPRLTTWSAAKNRATFESTFSKVHLYSAGHHGAVRKARKYVDTVTVEGNMVCGMQMHEKSGLGKPVEEIDANPGEPAAAVLMVRRPLRESTFICKVRIVPNKCHVKQDDDIFVFVPSVLGTTNDGSLTHGDAEKVSPSPPSLYSLPSLSPASAMSLERSIRLTDRESPSWSHRVTS